MSAKDKVNNAEAAKLTTLTKTDAGKQEADTPNWRKGVFANQEPAAAEQQEKKQQSEFGENITSVTYGDPSKIGKHAKRRAAKKAKQAAEQAESAEKAE